MKIRFHRGSVSDSPADMGPYVDIATAAKAALPTIRDVTENAQRTAEQVRECGMIYAGFMEAYRRAEPKA